MMSTAEMVGWLATALTLASFLMSRMLTLRIVNTLACFAWVTKGLLSHDWPILITNAVIAGIHIVWMIRNHKK